ncbi:putative methylase [Clavulina sp. PMI_390]|nr:putative methylase [Clavulina sp. PMI_390]
MIPTPDLSHLKSADYENVYEPAEDTFILLDALEKDADVLVNMRPNICLEIGSGSGCVSTFLHSVLQQAPSDGITIKPAALYLCTDINPYAASCTIRTGAQNNVRLDVIQGPFALPLSKRLAGQIGILIFNPPYVPTEDEEAIASQSVSNPSDENRIAGAWAGGEDGMAVTSIFLDQVEGLLSAQGRFYLVAVARNNVPKIREHMSGYGLQSEIVLQRRAGREMLFVLCFTRIAN